MRFLPYKPDTSMPGQPCLAPNISLFPAEPAGAGGPVHGQAVDDPLVVVRVVQHLLRLDVLEREGEPKHRNQLAAPQADALSSQDSRVAGGQLREAIEPGQLLVRRLGGQSCLPPEPQRVLRPLPLAGQAGQDPRPGVAAQCVAAHGLVLSATIARTSATSASLYGWSTSVLIPMMS